MTDALAHGLASRVLDYLGIHRARPGLTYLTHLLAAYVQRVPWESASRIARRATCEREGERPRWPELFWEEAIRFGTGGTCFESNLAFFALLRSLGFEGYLTLNNMKDSVGCHTACVIELDGESWIADAGYPVYAPIRIDPGAPTTALSRWMTYTLTPAGAGEYVLTQAPHPKPYAFNFINRPVTDARYRAATLNDYGQDGLFLSRVILVRVVDGRPCRFDSNAWPPALEVFEHGRVHEERLGDDKVDVLSARFQISARVLREAFTALAESFPRVADGPGSFDTG